MKNDSRKTRKPFCDRACNDISPESACLQIKRIFVPKGELIDAHNVSKQSFGEK
jgi:hypothetical protein